MTKSPSEQMADLFRVELGKAASLERERCARLVQQLADGTEDAVIKNTLEEVVVAIRRLADAN